MPGPESERVLLSGATAAVGEARGKEGSMPTRRAVLRGLGGAGGAAATGAVPQSALAIGRGSQDPVFTFASLPDFFNGDVADLSVPQAWAAGTTWVSEYWKAGLNGGVGAVAAPLPAAVFVAGEGGEGRWKIETAGRELSGGVKQHKSRHSIELCE